MMTQSGPSTLAFLSLRQDQHASDLSTIAAPSGTTYYVPRVSKNFHYDAYSVAVPDGINTIAGLGGGNWLVDQGQTLVSGQPTVAIVSSVLTVDQYVYDITSYGAVAGNAVDSAPAIQAAVNAMQSDPQHRKVWIPRAPALASNPWYVCNTPIMVTQGPAIIEFENLTTSLRAGHCGPVIIVTPPVAPPTIVQDGTTGFYGWSLNGTISYFLYLNSCPAFYLHGLSAFTFECWLNITDPTVGQGVVFSSNGRRGVSESTTNALTVQVLSNGKVQIIFSTTAGVTTLTSANALVNGVRTKVAFAYDSTAGANNAALTIGGNLAAGASATVTGTIVCLYEDAILGTKALEWPYGQGLINPIDGFLYQPRFSNFARPNYLTGFTPETTPLVVDNGTIALIDFAPSSQLAPAGLQKIQCQDNSIGLVGQPGWVQWQNTDTVQFGGINIKNICTTQVVCNAGLWLTRCPDARIERGTISAAIGLSLYNNCYSSLVDRVILNSATNAKLATKTQYPIGLWDGGLNVLNDTQTTGGVYSGLIVRGGGYVRRPYWTPSGAGSIFCKQEGNFNDLTIDLAFDGDEAKTQTDHSMFFTAPTNGQFGLNVTVYGGEPQLVSTNGPPIVEIDGGCSYKFDTTFWGQTGSPRERVFRFLTAPSVPVQVGVAQQNCSFSSGAPIPWMPETADVGTLSGTCTLTAGSYTVTFTSAQTLKALAKITFGDGVIYTIAADTSSSTTATLVQPCAASLAGAGKTATLVGQGPLLITTQEQFGQSTIQFPADADFTALVNTFLWKRLKLTTAVAHTATRKLIVPVVAGYSRKVWVNTTAGQSAQIIGPTGTGVTIAYSATPSYTEVYCDGTNWVAG